MGIRGSKEGVVTGLGVLDQVIAKIDKTRFPYVIEPARFYLQFFDSKLSLTPEMLVDLWQYHALTPNILLAASEKYIPLLEEWEVLDLTFRIKGLGSPHSAPEALLTHEVIFTAVDWRVRGHAKYRQLNNVFLESPQSHRDEESWDVIIPK